MGDVFESPIDGWFVSGKNPEGYEAGNGHLRSLRPETPGFATVMSKLSTRDEPAARWLGKRVRFRAEVRARHVTGWAGLWMRVDGVVTPPDRPPILAFDNMQERSIVGSVDWSVYETVLDVAADAAIVCFGLILGGDGEAWVRAATLEDVDPATPRTDARPPTRGVILSKRS